MDLTAAKNEITRKADNILYTISDVALKHSMLTCTAVTAGFLIGVNPAAAADFATNNAYTIAKAVVCGTTLITPAIIGLVGDVKDDDPTNPPVRFVAGTLMGIFASLKALELMP